MSAQTPVKHGCQQTKVSQNKAGKILQRKQESQTSLFEPLWKTETPGTPWLKGEPKIKQVHAILTKNSHIFVVPQQLSNMQKYSSKQ